MAHENEIVVCEVLNDLTVVVYDSHIVDEAAAGAFMEDFGVVEQRNFFVARRLLVPLEGDT
jgi:hypothetical protein